MSFSLKVIVQTQTEKHTHTVDHLFCLHH